MKAFCATALAVIFINVAPALASETIDIAELTCEQFNKYDDSNRGTVMMWLEGYYTEDDEPAVVDFGKMAGHIAQLMIKCEANPDEKVMTFTDEIMDD